LTAGSKAVHSVATMAGEKAVYWAVSSDDRKVELKAGRMVPTRADETVVLLVLSRVDPLAGDWAARLVHL